MSLVYFAFVLAFYGLCIFVIYWLLKRYVSSKPWHRWVRYAVWLSFIGLLTFDSIYYQIVVVNGMCKADKSRVYPAPPASYVTGGPYTPEQLKTIYGDKGYYGWPCRQQSTGLSGTCIYDGEKLKLSEYTIKLPFGGAREIHEVKDFNGIIYYRSVIYTQNGQWITNKLFGFGFVLYKQPESCRNTYRSTETEITIDRSVK